MNEYNYNQRDFYDYLAFLKRRKKIFFITFFIIFFSFVIIALYLPPVYNSTATILIEEQQIPTDLIKTTVSGYVEERLQIITQQIMSTPQLVKIIDKFNLYPKLRNKLTIDDLVSKLRNAIKLQTINANKLNPRHTATIAFSISFEGKNPRIVQEVTNYLASLYLEQNMKSREAAAKSTTQFLESQIQDVTQKIKELDKKIALFKQEHLTELPELMDLNLQTLRQMNDDLSRLDDQISNLEERKIYLEGQLATINPYLPVVTGKGVQILSPEKRLEILEDQYLSELATFSSKYPDVLKLKKEINVLKKQVSIRYQLQQDIKKLKVLEAQLTTLKTRVSNKYPDVKRLEKEIKILRQQIDNYSKQLQTNNIPQKPDNPSYITIETQIASTNIEIQNLKKQRTSLEKKIELYRKRLEKTPEVERVYQELLTSKKNEEKILQQLTDKLLQAKLGEGLEESQNAEHFKIIDPAQYPEKPIKPKRMVIIFIGAILGICIGLLAASLSEMADRSIKSINDVRLITNVPVVGIIPTIQNEYDIIKNRRKKIILYSFLFVLLLAATAFIIYFYTIKPNSLYSLYHNIFS